VEAGQELLDNGLPLALEILGQAGNYRAMLSPDPFLQETPFLFVENGLGGGDVLEPFLQCPRAASLQIVDIEQASLFTVMNARVEIARYGNIDNDERPGAAAGADLFIALQGHDRFRGAGSPQDDVGLFQG